MAFLILLGKAFLVHWGFGGCRHFVDYKPMAKTILRLTEPEELASIEEILENPLASGENANDENEFARLQETSRRLLEEKGYSERGGSLDEAL